MSGAPPVITIDGPAAAGKGTVAQLVAQQLGFYYLDSGKLYRAVAQRALAAALQPQDSAQAADIGACAAQWAAAWIQTAASGDWQQAMRILQDGDLLRPEIGEAASYVAKIAAVRRALLAVQRTFCRPPGLVADGRDMGTVVFADAVMKVFLQAPLRVRAERRLAQLQEKQIYAKIEDVLAGLEQRDARDSGREGRPWRCQSIR